VALPRAERRPPVDEKHSLGILGLPRLTEKYKKSWVVERSAAVD
jgi:hypothetical protein